MNQGLSIPDKLLTETVVLKGNLFFETRIGVRGWHFRNHFFESEYVSPQKARNRYQIGSLGGMVQDMFLQVDSQSPQHEI